MNWGGVLVADFSKSDLPMLLYTRSGRVHEITGNSAIGDFNWRGLLEQISEGIKPFSLNEQPKPLTKIVATKISNQVTYSNKLQETLPRFFEEIIFHDESGKIEPVFKLIPLLDQEEHMAKLGIYPYRQPGFSSDQSQVLTSVDALLSG